MHPKLHNILRLFRYCTCNFSLSVLDIAFKKGTRSAAAYLTRTGRIWDRTVDRGLPVISLKEALEKLSGGKGFTCKFVPSHTASIGFNRKQKTPDYLIGIIAAAVQPKYALEIGTGPGGGACQIAHQLADGGEVYTIDVPLAWADQKALVNAGELTEYHYFKGKKKYPWEGQDIESRIKHIREDSRTINYSKFNRKFDFVFIDGSHTEEAVRKDTELVLPYLNEGAVVLWHDYESSVVSHGVDKFLKEFSSKDKWPVRILEYTTLAIQIRR